LHELHLNGNNLGEGWLLVANGLLESANKYANKPLQMLDFSECNIFVKVDQETVIEKLIFQAELQWLGLNGAKFERGAKAIEDIIK
jgi:hypothetical protein